MDGDDEQGCATTCELTQYHCKPVTQANETKVTFASHIYHSQHRECISTKNICDGIADCPLKDGKFLYEILWFS